MEKRVTTYTEFALSNNVNGIRDMESTTLQGVTIDADLFPAGRQHRPGAVPGHRHRPTPSAPSLPPGIQPPVVMRFSASSVPVIQLAHELRPRRASASSTTTASTAIRQTLTTVPGSTLPSPYGGAPRQIMVDLDLHALQAYGLTPADVTNAMTAQNLTVPSGLAKFGIDAIRRCG